MQELYELGRRPIFRRHLIVRRCPPLAPTIVSSKAWKAPRHMLTSPRNLPTRSRRTVSCSLLRREGRPALVGRLYPTQTSCVGSSISLSRGRHSGPLLNNHDCFQIDSGTSAIVHASLYSAHMRPVPFSPYVSRLLLPCRRN